MVTNNFLKISAVGSRCGIVAAAGTIPAYIMRKSVKIGSAIIAAVALILLMFEVTFDPVLVWPAEREAPQPEQESAYLSCVDDIRRKVLEEAYAETDNPAVHSTMIRIAESEAPVECRRQYPVKLVTVNEPFAFNLVDFRYRY